MEALHRYEEKRLSRPLRLWVEATLELDPETPHPPNSCLM